MKRRHIPALAIPAGIVAALAVVIPGYAHNASISCGTDGDVHAAASQYNDGVYVIDGGAPHTFHGGFAVTLDGGTRHTLSVTADDWAPFNDSAGPCRATTTTEGTTSSTSSTSTTVGTSTSSSSPTTPTAPSSSASSSPTTNPSSSTDSSTTSPPTDSAPPSTEWQVGPPTCDHLTPEECNATETTEATSPAPSVASTSPSELTSPASTSPTSRSTAPGLPVTGPSPLAPEIVGIGFLALAAGTGAVAVARRRRP